MANNASAVLETHPQRLKVIAALTSGESTRSIAEWLDPKVSHNSIARYRRERIKPALAAKFGGRPSLCATDSTTKDVQHVSAVTRQALDADLFTQRLAAKYARYDRVLQAAETKEDYRAVAALDQAETRTMHFQAELEGRLNSGNTANVVNNMVIVLPTGGTGSVAPVSRLVSGPTIDIDISPP